MAVSQTLAQRILASAGDQDATQIVFDSATRSVDTTVGALVADAERAAGALRGLGVEPGDVVAVQLPGTYEGAVAQAAVALAGAVLLPIVMIYGPRELDFILRQSGAVALVTARVWRGRDHASVAAALPSRGGLRAVVVAGEGPAVPDGSTSFTPPARPPSPKVCATRTAPCWPRSFRRSCCATSGIRTATSACSRLGTSPACSTCCASCYTAPRRPSWTAGSRRARPRSSTGSA
jgi:acyl-coenzyme A synthetase/AMP-(fatty) acid ligase